jgi:hypothetical protein
MSVTILVTYANHCLCFVGSPIITDQHVAIQHGVCILSVYFYTRVSSVKIRSKIAQVCIQVPCDCGHEDIMLNDYNCIWERLENLLKFCIKKHDA